MRRIRDCDWQELLAFALVLLFCVAVAVVLTRWLDSVTRCAFAITRADGTVIYARSYFSDGACIKYYLTQPYVSGTADGAICNERVTVERVCK